MVDRKDIEDAHEMLEEVLADRMVGLLNELLGLDYEATTKVVFGDHVPCNKALADHPTVQVRALGEGRFGMRTMGLLNGLMSTLPDGYGRIGGEFQWRCSKHGDREGYGECGHPSEIVGGEPCKEVTQPHLLRFSKTPAEKHQAPPPGETVQ